MMAPLGEGMNYLQPQTLGSLIRASATIYFRNLPTLFLICGVMLVPLQLVHFILVPSDTEIGLLRGRSAAGAFFTFLELLAGTVAALPTTVAISEICLGM